MLLKPQEAANFLRVKVRTLSKWRIEDRGPKYRKIEGAVRYDHQDIESFGSTKQ